MTDIIRILHTIPVQGIYSTRHEVSVQKWNEFKFQIKKVQHSRFKLEQHTKENTTWQYFPAFSDKTKHIQESTRNSYPNQSIQYFIFRWIFDRYANEWNESIHLFCSSGELLICCWKKLLDLIFFLYSVVLCEKYAYFCILDSKIRGNIFIFEWQKLKSHH